MLLHEYSYARGFEVAGVCALTAQGPSSRACAAEPGHHPGCSNDVNDDLEFGTRATSIQ